MSNEAQSPGFPVQIQLIPENSEVDPADILEVSRNLTTSLQKAGYTVKPIYTGQKGGNLLLEAFAALTPILQSGLTNKELLLAMFKSCAPIVTHLVKQLEGKEKDTPKPEPIKLRVEVPQVGTMEFQARDMEEAAGLAKLADQFVEKHSQTLLHLNSQTPIKITGTLPAPQD